MGATVWPGADAGGAIDAVVGDDVGDTVGGGATAAERPKNSNVMTISPVTWRSTSAGTEVHVTLTFAAHCVAFEYARSLNRRAQIVATAASVWFEHYETRQRHERLDSRR